MPTATRNNTITARYAGTCTRTATRYPAGTLITRGAKGWEIAPSENQSPTTNPANLNLHDDSNDGHRPDPRQSNCTYCDTPTRGTVCDRCARACGERDSNEHGDGGEWDAYDYADAMDGGDYED